MQCPPNAQMWDRQDSCGGPSLEPLNCSIQSTSHHTQHELCEQEQTLRPQGVTGGSANPRIASPVKGGHVFFGAFLQSRPILSSSPFLGSVLMSLLWDPSCFLCLQSPGLCIVCSKLHESGISPSWFSRDPSPTERAWHIVGAQQCLWTERMNQDWWTNSSNASTKCFCHACHGLAHRGQGALAHAGVECWLQRALLPPRKCLFAGKSKSFYSYSL